MTQQPSSTSHHPPNEHIVLRPPTTQNIASLRRLNSLLLPINYPKAFYSDILASPTTTRLTRLALPPPPEGDGEGEGEGEGGGDGGEEKTQTGGAIYIMTLCTLSPYRHLGVGTRLVASVLRAAVELGCKEVYAHVWEANTEALEWYRRRGFDVDTGEVVKGYYSKLRPAGARVVRRRIGVGDAITFAARVGGEGKGEEVKGEGEGEGQRGVGRVGIGGGMEF
ncbi:hypothetical protein DFP73DRAFT_471314 [Morchella snyderi]|nr:hypothetical protein DFP73DRAFT_471314 [Morchella snyderi]